MRMHAHTRTHAHTLINLLALCVGHMFYLLVVSFVKVKEVRLKDVAENGRRC